jgi:hypothetical protein
VRRFLVSLSALVAAAVGLSACGSLSPYAAIVSGHRISERSINDELGAIKTNTKYLDAVDPVDQDPGHRQVLGAGNGTYNSAFVARLLTRSIYYELVQIELGRRHVQVTAKDLTAARQSVTQQFTNQGQDLFGAFPKSYQDTLVRRAALVAALAKSFAGTPTPADERAYYAAHQDQFEQACASHILVADKAKADAIEARLAKGEDFAAVAKTDSTDTGSAQKGGDIGCFARDAQLVQLFKDAAFAQPVGTPGPPVQTQFGFHIIKVTSRKVPTFEDVATQVRAALQSGGQDKLTAWLRDQLVKVHITVNPKFGKYDKNQQTPGVVPPQAPNTSVPAGPQAPVQSGSVSTVTPQPSAGGG